MKYFSETDSTQGYGRDRGQDIGGMSYEAEVR